MTALLSALGRRLDVLALVVALPVFIAAGFPLLGWAGTTVAWIGQLALQATLDRRAQTAEDTRQLFGYIAGSLIGRSWMLALVIFAVGIIDRPAGLAAAVLALVVFTIYLVTSLISRPTTHTTEPTA
ncbi:MAG: hypothetical protein IRZ32_00555 [Solirubrobacteraceae bacterium]|nr:hypothetical protein [Solirubrobacteraceae bacterium]